VLVLELDAVLLAERLLVVVAHDVASGEVEQLVRLRVHGADVPLEAARGDVEPLREALADLGGGRARVRDDEHVADVGVVVFEDPFDAVE